jgi:nucleoside triphosphate pyrophosphatase
LENEASTLLILASASPRRRDLLARLGLPFDVHPVDIDESPGRSPHPQVIAARIARTKAETARLHDTDSPILAADTVVALDGRILGKPACSDNAREMIRELRGRTHEVVTAVAFMPAGQRSPLVRNPVTRVLMREYSDAEIEASIARGDSLDKAGAYAIQDELFRPVESYEGCYCNVVGLPLWSTIELLRKSGINVEPDVGQLLPQCAACPLRPDIA